MMPHNLKEEKNEQENKGPKDAKKDEIPAIKLDVVSNGELGRNIGWR